MKLGGWGQLGGTATLGGGYPRAYLFWKSLLGLDPPGVYKEDPDTTHALLVRTDAMALGGVGQILLDRLDVEIWPQYAYELLEEWEELFEISPAADATTAERRAAVYARWKAPLSSSDEHIRMMVADLLQPTTMFWDRHSDSNVSFRYEQIPGNGSSVEGAGTLVHSIAGAAHGDWSATEQNAPKVLIPWNDRDDDMYAQCFIEAFGSNNGIAGGITLYESEISAICYDIYRTGGANYLRAWKIEDGTVTVIDSTAAPSVPFWLQLSREGDTYYFKYGLTIYSWTEQTSITRSSSVVKPRKFGTYCMNEASATYPAATITIGDTRAEQGQLWNNVELAEVPASTCPAEQPDHVFFAFVHREPTDEGSYDLGEAQRVLNRAKQGHTLILVGECDCFLCDDDYSLCDRDVLGV